MTRTRQTRSWMAMALAIALVALAIVTLRVTNEPASDDPPVPSEAPASFPLTPSPTFRAAVETPLPTATVPAAPIEAWAREMLVLIVLHTTYQAPQQDSDMLIVQDAELVVGSRAITLDEGVTLQIMLPSSESPSVPIVGGSIAMEDDLLVLTTSEGPRRMVGGGTVAAALRALMSAAASERLRLEAGIAGETEASVELVVVARSLDDADQVTPTVPGYTPLPMLGATTPTPLPDVNLALIVGEQTDSVIDAAQLFHPDAVMRFVESQSQTGVLTWSEQGPRVGGRLLNVAGANTLTLFMLNPNDPSMATTSFLELTYSEDAWITTLPEGNWFYGDRFEEALYWMVRRAAERDGQLLVVYDDLGTQQGITVIGFRPFED